LIPLDALKIYVSIKTNKLVKIDFVSLDNLKLSNGLRTLAQDFY